MINRQVTVLSCHLHPVKSLGICDVDRLTIEARGPRGDRRFMLVHADGPRAGQFITQRDRGAEKLAGVRTALIAEGVQLAFPDGTIGLCRYPAFAESLLDTKVFANPVRVQRAGGDGASALSAYLGKAVDVVYQPDHVTRAAGSHGTDGDETSLADGYALLVANAASLEALNNAIDPAIRVAMSRFRPNIVLGGLEPFEEDVIRRMRIGTTELELVKPCTRCQVPDIDQLTGERPSDEPGVTLRRLRMGKGGGLRGTLFGMNAQPRTLGSVGVGDPVTVLETAAEHPVTASARLGYGRSA